MNLCVELRIFTEPQQGATYDQLMKAAQAAELNGFGAFFRSDHYLRMGGGDPGPGPSDAWATLAGLARDTEHIRLGTLMTSATFRLPGPLAITVAGVDVMSSGRVELGIGAGWFEKEHRAWGIPFPATKERFDRLEEQLTILTGIWATPPGQDFSFSGSYYSLQGSPALPRPLQHPRPPLIIGGRGTRRTPALAARFADELNVPFADPDEAGLVFEALDAAAERADRDPAQIVLSVVLTCCCGSDNAEIAKRCAPAGIDASKGRSGALVGSPSDVVDQLSSYADLGVSRVYLQMLDLDDLDHIELIAEEVAPALT